MHVSSNPHAQVKRSAYTNVYKIITQSLDSFSSLSATQILNPKMAYWVRGQVKYYLRTFLLLKAAKVSPNGADNEVSPK
uniref:Uncharacterized protein n=1 Tax=Parascaris univalens TaxID=6257 RepID=A0A915A192_PARUN